MEKFSEANLKVIKDLYDDNIPKFYATALGGIILWSGFMFIPAELFGGKARRAGVSGNMMESLGTLPAIIFSLTLIIVTILAANWVLGISKLRKDLNEKEKIVTTVKVSKVENLSQKDIKELRKMGSDTTNSLHFEQNNYKIDQYPFNKITNPNLLNAKAIYLELAKHSRTEFKREVVEG